jgi:predicted phage replisome organizer
MGNETNNKRFYWLKLQDNFFKNARIKKLRRLAGGDTYTIIYLKMMLLTTKSNGLFIYEGIEATIEEEIALKLDEKVEDVKLLWQYLLANQMVEEKENGDVLLPEVSSNVGSETYNNIHKREKRLEKLQSHSNPIPIDIDKEKEIDIETNI